jgi:RHS repeat-associated protein
MANSKWILLGLVCLALLLNSCGGGGGADDATPSNTTISVESSATNDADGLYATGSVVRIDAILEPGAPEIESGTVRITSASQGYDSGDRQILFGSLYYLWETSGLEPAEDYTVTISIVLEDGTTILDNSLTVTLEPNPPVINKLVSETDVSFPSVGIPVRFRRTYLLDSDFDGPMGYGWTHSYRMRLVIPAALLPASSGDLLPVLPPVQVFNADGTGSWFFPNEDGMTYSAPKGDYRTLTRLPNEVYSLRSKDGTVHYFSSNGKLFRIEDRNGNAVTLQYDGFDMLDSVTDASGQVTTLTYDADGRIWAVTDPAGRFATYSYDSAANLVSVTDTAGQETNYTYDTEHNLTTITNPIGNQTFFTANSDDRLESVSGANDNNKVTFQYAVPAADQMTVTDALGNQTVITYDNNASITAIKRPLDKVTSIGYDDNLNVTSIVDGNSQQSSLTYDDRGNLLTLTDARGNLVTFTYDPVFNQITGITDANNITTIFSYDASGNHQATTYPDGSTESFTYDALGNPTSRTDRKGQTIVYAYNPAGQLEQKTFPDATTDTFTYDAAGNLLTATDENGSIAFGYDQADRVVEVSYPGGEVVSYTYDSAGNRTQITYPDGMVLDYAYDNLNRLTTIQNDGVALASYTYDLLSRVTQRNLQNGTHADYDYDDDGQLLGLANRTSTGSVISSFEYTYDSVGNRLTMTTLAGETQYVYDEINRLISVTEPSGSTTHYQLDGAGNRISVDVDGAVAAYTGNDLNQYTSVDRDTYQYDLNGNMTSKTTAEGVTTYTYDYEDQLIQVASPTETVSYSYDPFGRRNSKTTSIVTTEYVYSGLRVVLEKDGVGSTKATYIHGRRIDEVLLMVRGGSNYYYSHDVLGSVTDLTDSSQNVVESFAYDAYGIPSQLSSVGNPYLYTGREFEEDTGLYYYRARDYSPDLGRFLQTDPSGFNGGGHLYAYVSNHPVNLVDPFGLQSIGLPNPFILPGVPTIGNPMVITPSVPDLGREILFDGFPWEDDIERMDCGDDLWCHFLKELYKKLKECAQNPSSCVDTPPDGPPSGGGPSGDPGDDDDVDCVTNPDQCTCQEEEPEMCYDPCFIDPSQCMCSETNPDMCVADPSFMQKPWNLKIGDIATWLDRIQHDPLKQGKEGKVAKLVVPYENALVRADVPVFGLAFGKNFREYRLEYGEGTDPAEWIELTRSTTPQSEAVTLAAFDDSMGITIHGNLGTWDTGLTNYAYPPTHPKGHPIDLNGPYTLRLTVTGEDGSTVEDRVTVNVTNVIPNAWGGVVRSKDQKAMLRVPEQALKDIFRLISIQPAEEAPAKLPAGRQLVGNLYKVRDPNERFTKEAVLQLAYTDNALGAGDRSRLGVYGYDTRSRAWEYLSSFRYEGESSINTRVRTLHDYYALMLSDDVAEGSRLEAAVAEAPEVRKASGSANRDSVLVRNTFEKSTGEWSNRDNEVGGSVALDEKGSLDGSKSLKITNTNKGGNFAINVVTTPFDARDFPIVEFDYRVPAEVKTNFLVKVAGRWYEIGFTDDPHETQAKNVNIAYMGDIKRVIADDRWRTASFNLYEMLRTKTGHTFVEEMIMADWDVTGFMRLQFGRNAQDVTYYIDNFSIKRDPKAGMRMAEERLLIDDFDQEEGFNRLHGMASAFSDGENGLLEIGLLRESELRQGEMLKLTYDVTHPGSFVGYISELQGIDLRDYQVLELLVKGSREFSETAVIFKDVYGRHCLAELKNHLPDGVIDHEWLTIRVPLAAFSGAIDWSNVELMSLSFSHEKSSEGTLFVNEIALTKRLGALLVDDFSRHGNTNSLGKEHAFFIAGTAAINGVHVKNSPNSVYRLAYGGNIGDPLPGQPGLSHVGWRTGLGGIDCSDCEWLSFRVRGSRGGEKPNIYLDDGNLRWGLDIEDYTEIKTDWQEVRIPLRDYAVSGVDLTHLSELLVFFEWEEMSGTIYLDDIRLGIPSLH